MKDRNAYSKDDFIGFFLARDVSREIADETWSVLAQTAVIEGFKPRPEDELTRTFGLAEEDLDEDVVLPLLQRCKCRVPPPSEIEGMKPLETVADLVEFVSQMQHQR
jgi:hypothetical protein